MLYPIWPVTLLLRFIDSIILYIVPLNSRRNSIDVHFVYTLLNRYNIDNPDLLQMIKFNAVQVNTLNFRIFYIEPHV